MKIIIPLAVLLVAAVAMVYTAVIFYERDQIRLIEIKSMNINGEIVGLDEKKGGIHAIHFSGTGDLHNELRLNISYFIEKNGISIGDSISKDAQSELLYFFKKDAYGYQPCCVYQLEID